VCHYPDGLLTFSQIFQHEVTHTCLSDTGHGRHRKDATDVSPPWKTSPVNSCLRRKLTRGHSAHKCATLINYDGTRE